MIQIAHELMRSVPRRDHSHRHGQSEGLQSTGRFTSLQHAVIRGAEHGAAVDAATEENTDGFRSRNLIQPVGDFGLQRRNVGVPDLRPGQWTDDYVPV